MRAVQLISPQTLTFCDLPKQPLKGHEIRIQVAASSVCGTDLKNFKAPVTVPQIPGHEFSGTVLEVGSECCLGFSKGDRVTACPIVGCMQCAICASGNYLFCDDKKALGLQLPGAFSDEVAIHENYIFRLEEGITFEQGALVEHLSCAHHLVKELQNLVAEKRVHIAIIGDGPIALADVQMLLAFGYKNVSLIGKHAYRKDIAARLGIDRIIDARTIERRNCISESIDICIMAAPAERTLQQILPALRPGGMIFPQVRIRDEMILYQLRDSNISMERAYAYEFDDFPAVMKLIKQGAIRTDIVITTRLKLEEVAKRFVTFFDKESHCKIIINNF